jgi:hypothetical protein
MNFFWITTVLFLLFMYCKPSFPELEKLVKPIDEIEKGDEDYLEQDELDLQQDGLDTEQDSIKGIDDIGQE